MKLTNMELNKIEFWLIPITSLLCTILLYKILIKLRSLLPWRVNCWFCNSNTWVKYPEHNSWTCPKCDQYNGFTKDGDYNKTLITANDQTIKTPKLFQKKSPTKNGLCQMCNINQQLKVTQLANFVPMNDMNFEEEIETYRVQLEKAYKLCSPCRKVLQTKLYKEKEILLGSKMLETRSPDKTCPNHEKTKTSTKILINYTSMLIALMLFVLVTYEIYYELKEDSLPKVIKNVWDICKALVERVWTIIKMKIFVTFPLLETYLYDINNIQYADMLPKSFKFRLSTFDFVNTIQDILSGLACCLQIIANVCNMNSFKYTLVIDLLWIVFVISKANLLTALNPDITGFMKMSSLLALLIVYKSMKKTTAKKVKIQTSPSIKNLGDTTKRSLIGDDLMMDTDDDVSLSNFGLHNLSESSNEPVSPSNISLLSGRTFTPRNDSIWNKPKLNSTFCANSVICSSPSSLSETVFLKPTFNKYQKHGKNDSDSDLDESISSLSLGDPTKSKKKSNSIFSLRKFTASPSFVTPTPMNCSRPLISPSKLSTSWVAGGYWGSETDRQNIFNLDGSRSSSQSSGFESQTSSNNQRNVFSQPPSREESVCGEPLVLDRFSNVKNLSNYQMPQNSRSISSPVFPQMQYNSHVHIPQPRYPRPPPSHNLFNPQAQFVQNSMFKTPGGSGLIKLPQVNSFTSK